MTEWGRTFGKHPFYSDEFKRNAVQRSITSPKTIEETAQELGVSFAALTNWRKELGATGLYVRNRPGPAPAKTDQPKFRSGRPDLPGEPPPRCRYVAPLDERRVTWEDPGLTLKEAAEYCALSFLTIKHAIDQKKLKAKPYEDWPIKRTLIQLTELNRWMRSLEIQFR
jgi:hypothetical protein